MPCYLAQICTLFHSTLYTTPARYSIPPYTRHRPAIPSHPIHSTNRVHDEEVEQHPIWPSRPREEPSRRGENSAPLPHHYLCADACRITCYPLPPSPPQFYTPNPKPYPPHPRPYPPEWAINVNPQPHKCKHLRMQSSNTSMHPSTG